MLSYSIRGDLRFISHHDTLRLFQRALRRAKVPLRYSQGFNPHPKLSIPLPRPVGVASQAEAIVVELEEPIDPQPFLASLREQMPTHLELTAISPLDPGQRPQPDLVRYRLETPDEDTKMLEQRAMSLLGESVLMIERSSPKWRNNKELDVRPYIEDIRVEAGFVEMVLRVTGSGSVKPAEVGRLLGLGGEPINHRISRLEVQWRRQSC